MQAPYMLWLFRPTPDRLSSQTASRLTSQTASRLTPVLPPTKEEVNAFARVCLSVCLLAKLLKNACVDLDEMLRVDRCRDMDQLINF